MSDVHSPGYRSLAYFIDKNKEWCWQLYRNLFKSGEVFVLQLTISGNRSPQTPDPSSGERNNDKEQEPQRIWYIVVICTFFLMDLDSTISSNCNKPVGKLGWNLHSPIWDLDLTSASGPILSPTQIKGRIRSSLEIHGIWKHSIFSFYNLMVQISTRCLKSWPWSSVLFHVL